MFGPLLNLKSRYIDHTHVNLDQERMQHGETVKQMISIAMIYAFGHSNPLVLQMICIYWSHFALVEVLGHLGRISQTQNHL